MGKVFSWEEVEMGLVPKIGAHQNAKTMILETGNELLKAGILEGLRVYGSSAWDKPSKRSDLDVLVVYNDSRALKVLRDVSKQILEETLVDVEPVAVNSVLAGKGMHTMDNGFLKHLRKPPLEGNLVGVDPLELIKPKRGSILNQTSGVLENKIRRLTEATIVPEKDRLHGLQRLLELPVNVGRKLISTYYDLGIISDDLEDDSKREVVRVINDIFSENQLELRLFHQLLQKDIKYTGILDDALEGNCSEQMYGEFLNEIEATLPVGIKWLSLLTEQNYVFLEREGRIHNIEGNVSKGKEF